MVNFISSLFWPQNELKLIFSADVKQHSESLIDVVSQCLRSDLVNQTWNDAKSRKTQQTLANLVFKINVKMGGVNTQIARFDPM